MSSGNHMIDGADRELDKEDQCPACGSSSWPEETGYCGNTGDECTAACPDWIESYLDEASIFTAAVCAVMKFFGMNPYKNIEMNCPEYNDALRCENCGNVEKL